MFKYDDPYKNGQILTALSFMKTVTQKINRGYYSTAETTPYLVNWLPSTGASRYRLDYCSKLTDSELPFRPWERHNNETWIPKLSK